MRNHDADRNATSKKLHFHELQAWACSSVVRGTEAGPSFTFHPHPRCLGSYTHSSRDARGHWQCSTRDGATLRVSQGILHLSAVFWLFTVGATHIPSPPYPLVDRRWSKQFSCVGYAYRHSLAAGSNGCLPRYTSAEGPLAGQVAEAKPPASLS